MLAGVAVTRRFEVRGARGHIPPLARAHVAAIGLFLLPARAFASLVARCIDVFISNQFPLVVLFSV